jgi:putative transposase
MRLPCVTRIRTWVHGRGERLWWQLAPRRSASELASVAVDAVRSRRELILENAVLRHQVNVLRRRSKRPKLNLVDRLKLLVGARLLPSSRRAIAIVQPETVLRWHRAGFRLFWRRRSRPRKTSPLPPETIDLIRDMAARGTLLGHRAHPRCEPPSSSLRTSIWRYLSMRINRSRKVGFDWKYSITMSCERAWREPHTTT